ncbi:MAG TPA: hypothetical protein VE263_10415 [Candidatus Angelobacter sp.]|nr:hypothetical protein [Candidatus Angelobacter sp.]
MRRSLVLAFCFAIAFALGACSGPKGTVVNKNIAVAVNEPAPTVNVFGTMQFSATVTGTTNTAVTWQVNSVTGGSLTTGFISSTGLFFAPGNAPSDQSANPLPVTITAVSKASSSAFGTAQLTILATPNRAAQAGAVMLGTSGGNVNDKPPAGGCCSGTLGSLVMRNGISYILSNNHVLGRSDFATVGENISQPGLVDTVNCAAGTTVANFSERYNLQTGALPKVDAAIGQIVSGTVDTSGNILFLGSAATNGVPNPGAPTAGAGITPAAAIGAPHNGLVAKVGRTTALTCSTIVGANVAASITYTQNCDGTGTSFMVNYTDMVDVTGQFGAEGDSGSLIVTQDTAEAVALLVGGNATDTIGNAIGDVLGFFTTNGGSATTIVGGATHSVIGCTLPTKPANAVKALSVSSLSAETLQKAVAVLGAHGPELMAHPEAQAVGVGASYDNPAEAAILFFVTKGMPRNDLPQQVEGVRTRVIEGDLFASRGILSAAESAALEQSAGAPQIMYPISQPEYTRVKTVQTAHLAELLKLQGVQGVGISSSVDSPGEGSLFIYFTKGAEHATIPSAIDGVRTRVREGDVFRADYGGGHPQKGCAVPPAKKVLPAATPGPKA